MKVIRILALRRLRLQPLRAIVAAVTVAAGVSLAVGIAVTTTSMSASVQEAGRALAGPTPLRVIGATSRGGVADEVIAAVEATAGVEAAVPLVQAITLAEDAAGTEIPVLAFGVDCRVEALIGAFGCDPDLLGALPPGFPPAIAPQLAAEVGPGGVLRTDVGRIALDGALTIDALSTLNEGRVIAYPMAEAQRVFARPGAVDVVYVQPDPGVDIEALQERLEQAVGPWNGVLAATDPPPVVGVFLFAVLPIFTLISVMVLGIGAILVRNTVTLSLEERRRQTAIVAALGGRARVLVGGTLAEAALLGLVGGLLGAAGGIALAHPITASMSDFTQKTAGIPLTVHATSFAAILGAVLGAGVAVGAAFTPARRMLRLDVTGELSSRGRHADDAAAVRVRWLVLLGSLTVVGVALCWLAQRGGALEPWQATLAPMAFMLAVVGSSLLATAAAPRLVAPLRSVVSPIGASARLAIGNLVREPRRTGVMAVAVSLAVGTAITTASFTAAARRAIADAVVENLDGVSVSTLEPNNTINIDARIAPDVLAALATLPGVASVDRGATIMVGHTPSGLIGVDGIDDPWFANEVLDGSIDRDRFTAGGVLIGPALARTEGLRAGDVLLLDTPTGRAELDVIAVHLEGDFTGRNVLMSLALLERLYGPQPPSFVTVHGEPGVTDEELVATIDGAALDPDLVVQTAPELADRIADEVAEQTASFWALQRGLMVMSFVAVLSTLLLIGVQRQRELGMLAAVGMTPSQIARMVAVEGATVAVVGGIVGTLVSLVMYSALRLISPIVIGFKGPFVFDVAAAAIYCAVSVVIALLAAAWPAWRSARVEVLPALAYE